MSETLSAIALFISLLTAIIMALPAMKKVKAENQNSLANAIEKAATALNITNDQLIEAFVEVQKLKKENIEKDAVIAEKEDEMEEIKLQLKQLIIYVRALLDDLKKQGVVYKEPPTNLLDTGKLNKKK